MKLINSISVRANNAVKSLPSATTKKTYIMRGDALKRKLDIYHLIFAPTHACNLRCQHCYLPDHFGHIMPFEDVLDLIRQWEKIVLRDKGRLGGYFHLKGGEPLILPYLSKVLDYLASKNNLRFMMTTNGTLLKNEVLKSLIKLNKALEKELIIIVSLDGSSEKVHRVLRGPNNFDKTIKFSRALINAGINVHFNYVVHSGNLYDVPSFVDLAEEIGATQINFLPMVPKGYGLEIGEAGRPDPKQLHETIKNLYQRGNEKRKRLLAGNYAHILELENSGIKSSPECVAGYKGLFYVTPEGNVYSCPNLINSNLMIGNFLETPLEEIHDKGVNLLYKSHLVSTAIDDRYLCRGERLTKQELVGMKMLGRRSLPILREVIEKSNEYPVAARQLQNILVSEGRAKLEVKDGTSYCFSRNF